MAMEFPYDLVVLDLNLSGIDGLSILKSLRQRKLSVPVMILTARSRVEDRVQCLDSGADDYLVKPFSFLELSARARAPVATQSPAVGIGPHRSRSLFGPRGTQGATRRASH